MQQHHEEQVRRRAYEIWENEGRPEGCEARHWQQAQAEIGAANGEARGWIGDPPQANPPRAAGESAPGELEDDLGPTPGPTSAMDRDLAGGPGATSTLDEAGPTPGPTSPARRTRRGE